MCNGTSAGPRSGGQHNAPAQEGSHRPDQWVFKTGEAGGWTLGLRGEHQDWRFRDRRRGDH